jgi:hypothetical protein
MDKNWINQSGNLGRAKGGLIMPSSKINHGARQAAEEDRRLGMLHVMKGHHSLGTMHRVWPNIALKTAFATYQKLESGEAMQQTQADAIRLLMLVA